MNQEQWRVKQAIWAVLPLPSGNSDRGEAPCRVGGNGEAPSIPADFTPSRTPPLHHGCGEWSLSTDRRLRHV
jgi:hypothetical protein